MEKEREKSHFFERISFYEVPLKTLLLYHVAVGSGGGPRLEQEVPEEEEESWEDSRARQCLSPKKKHKSKGGERKQGLWWF